MRSALFVLFLVLALPAPAPFAQPAPLPAHAAPAPRDPALPPSEDDAKAALDASPRHGEFVDIPHGAGHVPIRTWVVYPEGCGAKNVDERAQLGMRLPGCAGAQNASVRVWLRGWAMRAVGTRRR